MTSQLIACVVVVMVVSATSVIAQSKIKCYQCNSNEGDTWYLDPFKGPPANAPATVDCNGTLCIKQTTSGSGEHSFNLNIELCGVEGSKMVILFLTQSEDE